MPPSPETPRALLTRGLRAGDLSLIRRAARELGPLPLDIAFEVLMLIGRKEPHRWGPATVRFVGQVALRQPAVALDDIIDLARVLRDGSAADAEVLGAIARDLAFDVSRGLHLWPPQATGAGE